MLILTYICLLFSLVKISFAECGSINIGTKIIGGTDVTNFKYPWFGTLMLKIENIANCAGSLITDRYFVTAAHCFYGRSHPEQLYYVILGTNDICNISGTAERFGTERVIVHEDYEQNRPFSDIALVYLDRNADNFEKICLSPANFRPRTGSIIGFGVTATGKSSCILQEATVRIYTRAECIFETNLTPIDVGTGTICAGRILGGTDSCQGDSGGPLQYEINNRYYIIGIVSFGFGCAEIGYPGVYTDIRSYNNWIKRHINNNNNPPNNNPLPVQNINRPFWLWWTLGQLRPYL